MFSFGLYTLFKVVVFFLNAVAVINERFLHKVGWDQPGPVI